MEAKEFQKEIFSGLSKLLKAISNPSRLRIIEMLSQGEMPVEEIARGTGMSIANASQHLQVLKNSNIVRYRKEGHYVFYILASDEFLSMYRQITRYAVNEIAELEKMINRQRDSYNTHDAVSFDELEQMAGSDNVLLLDLRSTNEFEFGHIKGAVSIPMQELIINLKTLNKEKEIIAYCRGPFCLLADEAVKILRESGYRARRLEEGYPEWKVNQPV